MLTGRLHFWISLSLSLFAQSKIRTKRKLNQKVKSIFFVRTQSELRTELWTERKTELIVWSEVRTELRFVKRKLKLAVVAVYSGDVERPSDASHLVPCGQRSLLDITVYCDNDRPGIPAEQRHSVR